MSDNNMSSKSVDPQLIQITFEQENQITEEIKPLVLDPGSVCIDVHGVEHTLACGWLAIQAGLLYADFSETIPVGLWKKMTQGLLRFEFLKAMSSCTYSNARLSEPNIRKLSASLNITIVVWETGTPTYYNEYADFRIDLWLTSGHYYLYIRDPAREQHARYFASQYGYTVDFLAPITLIKKDKALAKALQNKYINGHPVRNSKSKQIKKDRKLAKKLYAEELRKLEQRDRGEQ